MTPERRALVERVCSEALECEPSARDAYLVEACAGDEDLLREVESLLAQEARANGFLDSSPYVVDPFAAPVQLLPGQRIGHYEVHSLLGVGGVGQVYRASDTRLRRHVALKVLSPLLADPTSLARFAREAQILAGLNHPNIAVIYGVEEADGLHMLVLELVEGETLAARLEHGALPLGEALQIAGQIASALDAAHTQGLIHRDLKPSNIAVRTDGTVKVLDFGIAKALTPKATDTVGARTPSPITNTQPGLVLGTAAYMSPEQARGQLVDGRTDIWAFGCLLFEMLTGRAAFFGDTITDTLAAVVGTDPDWSRLPNETPEQLRRLLRRCLQKDHARRLRDIVDARLEIEEVSIAGSESVAALSGPAEIQPSTRGRSSVRWVAGLLLCVGLAGGAAWVVTNNVEAPVVAVKRFTIALPASDLLPTRAGKLVEISPDGKTLLYKAQRNGVLRLYARPMDQLEAVVIGDDNPIDFSFSPDGRWVVFNVERTLRKVAVSGGPSQTLITLPTLPYHGASWGADDTIVTGLFGADLVQVPASGGTVTTLAAPSDNRMFWHPQILPGGRAVLFTASEFRPDEQEVQVLVLSTGERRTLVTGSAGRFLPSGHLVFVRGATMWAVGFDPERLEVRGTPVPILEGIRVEPGGAVQFSVGEDGTLVYLRGTTPGNRLAWIDRAGKVERLDMASQSVLYPRLSPDGTRVALIAQGGIWIWHLGRKTFTRLTDPGSELKSGRYWNVWWTPDGQRLVLAFQHENEHAVYWQAADGTGAAERIVTSTTWIDQGSVSPDGRWLVLGAATSASGHDIVAVDLGNMGGLHARVSSEPSDSTRELRPLVQTKFNERNPEISPDGRWVAYDSDESGSFEVYVRPFPDVNAGRWQISERGGVHPRWGRNGHELFYVAPDRSVMSAPMQPRTGLAVGGATRVADLSPSNNPHGGRMYDVSADGTRILAVQDADEAGQAEIHVVLNWIEELKQRVPTR